jgi:post-segregation antitoxin (ccd killing protein)
MRLTANGQAGRNVKEQFKPPKNKHIWVAIHPDVHRQLIDRAKRKGVTISEMIRQAIKHELSDHHWRRIRQVLEDKGSYETGQGQ